MKSLHGWEGNKKALRRAKTAFQKEVGDYLPASFFSFFLLLFPTVAFFKLRFQQRGKKGKNRKFPIKLH
jgi:hypothetical protein